MYASMLSFPGSLFGQFDRLQRDIDELLNRTGMPASIRSVAPGAFPAINVGGAPGSVEVYAFVPGVDPAKVEITLDRGVLTIAGERPSDLPAAEERTRVYGRERFSGKFQRSVSLPEDIDPSKVQANYRDGVLRVSIGRRQEALPKRIAIQ